MKPAFASRGLAALAALLAALISLGAAGQAVAQVQRTYLNPGFESPALTA
ncbi:MAG: hypothetical protein IT473_14850, partial [Lysobacter sp.]|nr:hypothetical protein [Lysobacter sp.]